MFLYFIDFVLFDFILFFVYFSYLFFSLSTINFWLRNHLPLSTRVSENWATCRKRRIENASEIAVFLSCTLSYFPVPFILLKARSLEPIFWYFVPICVSTGFFLKKLWLGITWEAHSDLRRNTVAKREKKKKRNLKNNHLLIHLRIKVRLKNYYIRFVLFREKNPIVQTTIAYFFS